MQQVKVSTQKREELVDITGAIRDVVQKNKWQNGVLLVYCTHTTAGVTINESADPSVVKDMLKKLKELVPANDNYSHMEGNSDAHIKSSLIGCSEQLIVEDGKLVLGTWQGIFFAEFDGPRSRKVCVQFLPGK
ncbi:MAG: secondary thiamine-phosphate synthase enzyme YjbQ [Thermodesulfobacteriota bacterium]